MRVEQVNLVDDFDARLGERVEFAENLFDLRFLLVAVGGGGVAHVEQNFSLRTSSSVARKLVTSVWASCG